MSLATDSPLDRLQAIVDAPDMPNEDRLTAIMQLGREAFALDLAIISHIVGSDYHVQYAYPPDAIPPGQVFELGKTYCSITIKFPLPVAIAHMQASEHNRHPCYEAFKLESYIGASLMIDGKLYGTVNFSSPTPRKPYTHTERQLIQRMGAAVSAILTDMR